MIIDDGIELIKHFEGFRNKAYQDTAGIWTIGYGHTKNVKENDIIDINKAKEYLQGDLHEAYSKVCKYVPMILTEKQKASLVSQAYNLTTKSFKKLAEYLLRDKQLYLNKLLLYCKDSAGNKLKGLETRRKAEQLLFLGKSWEEIKQSLEIV